MDGTDGMRIGELAARVGVTTDVLRAWERRHALFVPTRSSGGYRLYGPDDESRARRVHALRQRGATLPDAVSRVLNDIDHRAAASAVVGLPTPAELVDRLDAAVLRFDSVSVNAALDEAVDLHGLETGLTDVALGYLRRLGDQWASGRVGVAHEHFASHLIRRRVSDRLRLHPADGRPTVVLACPPAERHDIALLVLGVLLSRDGWCVRFLGADTPLAALVSTCEALDPSVVILSTSRPSALAGRASAILRLSHRWPLAIGGRGADARLAAELGAYMLPEDLRAAPAAVEDFMAGVPHVSGPVPPARSARPRTPAEAVSP